jgi:2-iminobutanoate/2-iminopropanoate deaminase
MEPTAVQTDLAPAAIGPYSQAQVYGNFVFASGQIPLDPATGQIVGATAAEQTTQVMRNLAAVLEACGSRLDLLLKTTIFLVDLAAFGEVNAAYATALGAHRPARATIQVAALPKGALVEIEGVAVVAG